MADGKEQICGSDGAFEHRTDRNGHFVRECFGACDAGFAGRYDALNREIIILGKRTEEKEREVENICINLLLKQQPVASDLRQISAALKMITDLSRIGEQAGNIAEILGKAEFGRDYDTTLLQQMATAAKKDGQYQSGRFCEGRSAPGSAGRA